MKWYRKTSSTVKVAGWKEEFGPQYEVPDEIADLVQKGLAEDTSSRHKGVCPSFGTEAIGDEGEAVAVELWVEHPNPISRAEWGSKRFLVSLGGKPTVETNDLETAVARYLELANFEQPKKPSMTLESVQERMWDLTHKPGEMTPEDRAEMGELRKKHRELHPQKRELPKFMASRKGMSKTADWGHGDTLDGQLMRRELDGIRKEIKELRLAAETNALDVVLPRWRGEIRHKILLLPTLERIGRMSMSELGEVRDRVEKIKAAMKRYNQNLFLEIMGD